MAVSHKESGWLLLIFSLPAKQAAQRVDIWRKLRRAGVLALPSSGYVLPETAANQETLEWIATAIRKYRGSASVVTVHSFDNLPFAELKGKFLEARARDYEEIARNLRQMSAKVARSNGQLARLRRRLQEIMAIDFFKSPWRSRVEALLEKAENPQPGPRLEKGKVPVKKEFRGRVWITRPRPGIDRSASAWLIRKFIDPRSRFVFGDRKKYPKAVPFDMYGPEGFGHRGEDCTFETLRKEFGIRDAKVAAIAQMVHDADLNDAKFGRSEGMGIHRVLKGWAQQGISDGRLLRKGMELFEGLYQSVS